MDESRTNWNRRILLIDDMQAIHDDIRKILAQRDDGAAALDSLESEMFGGDAPRPVAAEYAIDSALCGQDG